MLSGAGPAGMASQPCSSDRAASWTSVRPSTCPYSSTRTWPCAPRSSVSTFDPASMMPRIGAILLTTVVSTDSAHCPAGTTPSATWIAS